MIFISTYLHYDLHVENLLNTIAYPFGHRNEYRYHLRNIAPELREILSTIENSNAIYGVHFEHHGFVPIRSVKIISIETIGEYIFFVVELGSLISDQSLSVDTNSDTLVFKNSSQNIKSVKYQDKDWSKKLEYLATAIKNELKKDVCFLNIEITKSHLISNIIADNDEIENEENTKSLKMVTTKKSDNFFARI